MRISPSLSLVTAFLTTVLWTHNARADALAKLELKTLEAVHQAVETLRAEWKAVPRLGSYREHRANLHVHSRWSHDSRGTIDEIVAAATPGSDGLRKGKQVGDELYRLLLDPYENSLRHVGTHLLLSELSEKAVREALEGGRAFVAFDWLADSTGFDFAAVSDAQRHEMGSQLFMTPLYIAPAE